MDEKLQKQVQELEKEYDKYLPYSARYDLAKDEAFLNYLTYMIEEQNVKNKELRIPQNEFIDDESLPSYMIVGVNGLREYYIIMQNKIILMKLIVDFILSIKINIIRY